MLSDEMSAVMASCHRCMSGKGFTDTFYMLFLASSEEVRTKFQFTDMARQKLAIGQSLLTMILFNVDPKTNREALERLAIRHDRNHADIAPHLYTLCRLRIGMLSSVKSGPQNCRSNSRWQHQESSCQRAARSCCPSYLTQASK